MRINIAINDDTIRQDVESAVSFAEWDNFIGFPDVDARETFIGNVTEDIISRYEVYPDYNPNYAETVLDMASLFGYAL